MAGDRAAEVDWDAVDRAGYAASGLPTPVTGGNDRPATDQEARTSTANFW